MNIREALDVAEKIAHEGDWTPTDFDLEQGKRDDLSVQSN